MHLLGFDTSTQACTVALWSNGRLFDRFAIAPQRHGELLLPWIGELLNQAGIRKSQLDGIAVGCGPGAFTGVRLAVSMAQGIAVALDRPVVPVSTLQTLAQQAPSSAKRVLACLDARMSEVYVGIYHRDEQGQLVEYGSPQVCSPTQLRDQLSVDPQWVGIGPGLSANDGDLANYLIARNVEVIPDAHPRAIDLLAIAVAAFREGQAIRAEHLAPMYLRNRVALTLSEQSSLKRSS